MTLPHIRHFVLGTITPICSFWPLCEMNPCSSQWDIKARMQGCSLSIWFLVSAKCGWHGLCCRTHAIQPICARVGLWACGQRDPEENTGLTNYKPSQPNNMATWHPDASTLLHELFVLLDKDTIKRLYISIWFGRADLNSGLLSD